MTVAAQRRVFEFGLFRLDAVGCILFRGKDVVPLSPKATRTLLMLVENAGQVVSKEEILQKVWPDTFVGDSSLTRTIFDLRKALSTPSGEQKYIATVSKRGYRFVASVREASESERSLTPRRIMLAVLPFENLSEDRDQNYLADGLTEEMISQLGRINPDQLGVIARTSAMLYKSTQKSIGQIGSELAVDYIVEGSVRRAEKRVRITAQLIQTSDQAHFWSESYDRDFGDILHLEQDVARSVAHEIKVTLVAGQQHTSSRTVNPQAHELYLKGRYLWNQRSNEALRRGLNCFEKAIQIDPSHVEAYAGIADVHLCSRRSIDQPASFEAVATAKRAAARALEIDPTSADAHISMGHAYMQEFDWRAAAMELECGLKLNPNYAVGHLYYSAYLAVRERFEEAILYAQRAESLDPLSVSAIANTAWIYCFARRYDESIKHAFSALELDTRFVPAQQVLSRAYLQKGLSKEAIAVLKKAVVLSEHDPNCEATLAHALAVSGNRTSALRLLEKLLRTAKTKYVSPFSFALIQAGLGNLDDAFHWLEEAYRQRVCALEFLHINPSLTPIRSDPRFHSLIERLDLDRG